MKPLISCLLLFTLFSHNSLSNPTETREIQDDMSWTVDMHTVSVILNDSDFNVCGDPGTSSFTTSLYLNEPERIFSTVYTDGSYGEYTDLFADRDGRPNGHFFGRINAHVVPDLGYTTTLKGNFLTARHGREFSGTLSGYEASTGCTFKAKVKAGLTSQIKAIEILVEERAEELSLTAELIIWLNKKLRGDFKKKPKVDSEGKLILETKTIALGVRG
jgi:hypothetical protein